MIYDKNHPLRVCTLCSGYDSQCLALINIQNLILIWLPGVK